MNIEFVTVVNNHDMYRKYFTDNPHIAAYSKIAIDNTVENIPITRRFNDYIEKSMPRDTFVVFCHQDLEFVSDPGETILKADPDTIFGPVGAAPRRGFAVFMSIDEVRPFRLKTGFPLRSVTVGRIFEDGKHKRKYVGKKINKPTAVETLDCCCFAVNSESIRRHGLRFDENLEWHLYSEDFSLSAREKFGIETFAVALDCVHHSGGNFDPSFAGSLAYLKQKVARPFASTCHDGYRFDFTSRL